MKVFFEGDQRDPWAETSDLKRQAEWPTAQQLQGFNPDMIFNSISKMKNTRSDVSKAFSNASSLVANLHKLKK